MQKKKIDRRKKARYLSEPVAQLKLSKNSKLADVVEDFASMSIQARRLGSAAQIYRRMLEDKTPPVIFLGLAVNVPLLRTLAYVQINIHVVNLILLSLLLYRKHVFLSAIALALASHMKVSPLILAPAFLITRDWKWLFWFIIGIFGMVLLTSTINSFDYFFHKPLVPNFFPM